MPSATTDPRPMARAATVRPVRTGSRPRLARPSSPCAPNRAAKGRPMRRAKGWSPMAASSAPASRMPTASSAPESDASPRWSGYATTPTATAAMTRPITHGSRPPRVRPGWDGRSASSGDSREAARAGTRAPARVTRAPRTKASSRATGWNGRPPMSSARLDCRTVIRMAATATPSSTPTTPPSRPRARPWRRKSPITCREVVPAARSSPTSRVRSARVMASVLATRNAPTASATSPNRKASPANPAWARPSCCSASATVSTTNGSVMVRSSAARTSSSAPSATFRST